VQTKLYLIVHILDSFKDWTWFCF